MYEVIIKDKSVKVVTSKITIVALMGEVWPILTEDQLAITNKSDQQCRNRKKVVIKHPLVEKC